VRIQLPFLAVNGQTAESLETEEALLRQNQIAILEGPKQRALNVARCQAYQSEDDEPGRGKRRRPVLGGLAASRLDESNRRDLIAVRRLADKDLLSRFLQDHWMFKVRGPIVAFTQSISQWQV